MTFVTGLAIPPGQENDRLLWVASAAAVLRTSNPNWRVGQWMFRDLREDEHTDCAIEKPHLHVLARNREVLPPGDAEVDDWSDRPLTEVGRGAVVMSKSRWRKRIGNWLIRQASADLEGPLPRALGVRTVYTLDDYYLCPICEEWVPNSRRDHVDTYVG